MGRDSDMISKLWSVISPSVFEEEEEEKKKKWWTEKSWGKLLVNYVFVAELTESETPDGRIWPCSVTVMSVWRRRRWELMWKVIFTKKTML